MNYYFQSGLVYVCRRLAIAVQVFFIHVLHHRDFAENRAELGRQNFTHVLNCAHSSRRSNDFYSGMGITYMGIEAHDSPVYDMSVNFDTGAEFIHHALNTGGRVSTQTWIHKQN